MALEIGLWCVPAVPPNRFWTLLEAPKKPKSIKNRLQTMSKMKKVKMLIFDTPPLHDHCFWVPTAAKMELKIDQKSIFIAIENYT